MYVLYSEGLLSRHTCLMPSGKMVTLTAFEQTFLIVQPPPSSSVQTDVSLRNRMQFHDRAECCENTNPYLNAQLYVTLSTGRLCLVLTSGMQVATTLESKVREVRSDSETESAVCCEVCCELGLLGCRLRKPQKPQNQPKAGFQQVLQIFGSPNAHI